MKTFKEAQEPESEGCHTESCVMAHSSKARKLGLDWLQHLLTEHRYTTFGMVSASEDIDVWVPVPTKGGDSDIQLPQAHTAIRTIGAEEVEVWIAVSQELMRQEITRQLMRLYAISFLVGLVVFALTQNVWLLTTFGLLPILIRWIVGYYFRHPQK